MTENEGLLEQLRVHCRPLRELDDLEPLFERMHGAAYVVLGEATHGTSEFYRWRAAITRRLIERHGVSFVAVEGDWPDCQRAHRFVVGAEPASEDDPHSVLHAFERWPTWLWANLETVEFIGWLRGHNAALPSAERVGFHGLDLYSLRDSLQRVWLYLHKHHPRALPAARKVFDCFEPYGDDLETYALASHWLERTCEDEVVELLSGARGAPTLELPQDSLLEGRFDAEQNALVVQNAEHYYRTMVRGGAEAWNLRDRHMVETLERLMRLRGGRARAVIWAHNTHVGDARFTDMQASGTVSIGQLLREAHSAQDVVLVGFGAFEGSVIAGRAWGAPLERMPLPAARPGSWEELLHRLGARDRWLLCGADTWTPELLEPRGHRAVGVVYRPNEERGNYVPSVLPRRYDAFLYLEHTRALHPLHEVQPRSETEVPETFPSGV